MCAWLPQRPEEGPESLVVHSMNYHALPCELWELKAGPFGRAGGAFYYPSMVLPSPSMGFVVVVLYVLKKSIDPTTGSYTCAALSWTHRVKLQCLKINSSGLKHRCCFGGRWGQNIQESVAALLCVLLPRLRISFPFPF